ncbi:hypothetical protein [Henriciella pelagia]|uniref:hypothetical protein n=1 Tax=Henriciella pelagia TaxID=1977912 RepID=UPI003517F808
MKLLMVLLVLLVFGGEGVASVLPEHDHHSEAVLGEGPVEVPENEHGRHAIHGCGVCHHMVDGRLLVIGVMAIATDHKYDFTADRISSRALEPPFQPPIEFSV